MTSLENSPDVGVYQWLDTSSGKIYVGSSLTMEKRRKAHMYELKTGRHKNKHLQRAFNLRGECFQYSVLEYCCMTVLRQREQYYLDKVPTEKRFNMSLSVQTVMSGRRHTDETKLKLRKLFTGRLFSDATRARISTAKTGKTRPPFSPEHKAKIAASMRASHAKRRGMND